MFLRLLARPSWLVLAVCAVLPASGCSGPTTVQLDAGAPADGAAVSTGTIVLESEGALGLSPGGEATFRARWLGADGQPVVGGAISFGLEGMPRDSTLRTLGATTDGEGRVRGTLVAGAMPGAFRVRVAAAGASPAYLDVAVGAEGFGRILVEVRSEDVRAISTRSVSLHLDTGCADALTRREGDRMRDLAAGETMTEFVALPAEQVFTVVATGKSERGTVVASGCLEGVRVAADASIRAVVALRPEPLQVGGEYGTTVSIASPGAGALAAAALGAALADVAGAGADHTLLLDTLERELRDRGREDAADVLALERLTGEPDAALRTALDAAGAGPVRSVASALADLVPGLDALLVEGTLAIAAEPDGGALASFARGRVQLEAATGETVSADLAGIEARRPATVRWALAEDALHVDSLEIALPLGTLTDRALAGLARARGAESTLALLAQEGGCAELDALVEARPEVRHACDPECVESVCHAAIDGVLSGTLVAAPALDETQSTVALAGVLACDDGDGDLVVDAMRAIALSGAWTSADGTSSAPIAADLEGARLSVLP